jgi:hypothetical protein
MVEFGGENVDEGEIPGDLLQHGEAGAVVSELCDGLGFAQVRGRQQR